MDRHSFLSALPFTIPVWTAGTDERDDPFLAEPSHVVLRDHQLSIEVEDHGVAFFDASGVSSNDDPAVTTCQVYLEESKLCLKLASRVYCIDWSQITHVVLKHGKQNDIRPPSILLQFACCSFRFFSLLKTDQDNNNKLVQFHQQLESLLASDTLRPSMPLNDELVIARKDSSATTTSGSSCASPAEIIKGRQSSKWPTRMYEAAHASHEGLQSLITVLQLPQPDRSMTQDRQVFNLLNTVADDMNASYLGSHEAYESKSTRHDRQPGSGTKRACPDQAVWSDFFPAPRAAKPSVLSCAKDKEKMMQATLEWMEEQKRMVAKRHKAMLLRYRG